MIKRYFALALLLNILINLAHPVTPTIIKDANVGNYMFGVAYACMAIGQLVSSGFWGNLAKKKGEISTIVLGLIVYCIGQYAFYFSDTQWTIILARLLSGIGAGGFMVATISYLAKIAKDNKTKYLTLYTAITVFSSTIGYLIGGLIGDNDIKLVFIIQIVGLIVVMVGFKLLLKEVINIDKISNIKVNNRKLFKEYMLLNVLVFISLIASVCYDQSFNYYIKDILNFMPSGNGMIKAFVGIAAFIVNAIFSKKQKRDKEYTYLSIIYSFCFVSIIGLIVTNKLFIFLSINTIFFIFNSLYLPILQGLYLKDCDSNDYAVLSGNFNMCKSFGMIVGALIAGFVYELHPSYPFIVSSMMFIMAIGTLYIIKIKK